MQSGCDIASVVLRDLDQLYQGQIFQMQISLKWLAKHYHTAFIDSDIWHWMAPFPNWRLYIYIYIHIYIYIYAGEWDYNKF